MAKTARLRLEAVAGYPRPVEAPARDRGGVRLGTVLAREGERFRIRAGGLERLVPCDPSVDPALVEEAIATGARVVLDGEEDLAIVGALATSRAVTIDRQNAVRLAVERFEVTAADAATLSTGAAFLRVKGDEVETFGRRVLTRAREVARILARAIQLN